MSKRGKKSSLSIPIVRYIKQFLVSVVVVIYINYSTDKTNWNTIGYDYFHNLHISEKRHTNSVAHILAMKALKLFGKNRRIEFSVVNRTDYRFKTTIKR